MDHYIDIHIFPNPEIESSVLMNSLFYQLHLLFVDRNSEVAVSFPKYRLAQTGAWKNTLGSVLRLHGSHQSLLALDTATTLTDALNYAAVSGITPVPKDINEYAVFVRKHAKSQRDIERKRQHLLKKAGGEWNEIAQESMDRFMDKLYCKLPFIYLTSHSSIPAKGEEKNHFSLFISKENGMLMKGKLTKYGLSDPTHKTSVPIF
ncbi:type I-F CRISPR-associated endoribonuclease Cas6/Csy4 [Budvicia aquatica]|uniref:CRISPR-associated protein Cas6/Csy4, subtype I-F/YPEST n=1 Tax=Budvicia aquatica TaxID=82979 RepID=A0A2C6C1S7_9GAMM|nr:type I-F CRISPR-associated endoribonuclease Cas6/Csy4 [Budvicia aquatica]PHI30300.1 type I-F CRISPR-associated endoribonuclease Cas6/Csy4 [Budvicia aquatica]VFS49376.1 CRISPR-associated protein Cas6/Csy4, subtype I-F/YPEST [Budvicia aquatica]